MLLPLPEWPPGVVASSGRTRAGVSPVLPRGTAGLGLGRGKHFCVRHRGHSLPVLCQGGTKQWGLTSRCAVSPAENPPSHDTASWASVSPRCRRRPLGEPVPPHTQGCCIYWFPPRTALSQTGNLKSDSPSAPSSRCGFHVCGPNPIWTVSKESPPRSSPKSCTQAQLMLCSALASLFTLSLGYIWPGMPSFPTLPLICLSLLLLEDIYQR